MQEKTPFVAKNLKLTALILNMNSFQDKGHHSIDSDLFQAIFNSIKSTAQ